MFAFKLLPKDFTTRLLKCSQTNNLLGNPKFFTPIIIKNNYSVDPGSKNNTLKDVNAKYFSSRSGIQKIKHFVYDDDIDGAFKFYKEFYHDNYQKKKIPAPVFTSLFKACLKLPADQQNPKTLEIFRDMKSKGDKYSLTPHNYTSFLHSISQCTENFEPYIDLVFQEIKALNWKRDLGMYNSIISSYIKHKNLDKAYEWLEKMKPDLNHTPGFDTYLYFWNHYSLENNWQKKLELFETMKTCKFHIDRPTSDMFHEIIEHYLEQKELEKAYGEYTYMRADDRQVLFKTYELLINALVGGRKEKMALEVLDQEIRPSHRYDDKKDFIRLFNKYTKEYGHLLVNEDELPPEDYEEILKDATKFFKKLEKKRMDAQVAGSGEQEVKA